MIQVNNLSITQIQEDRVSIKDLSFFVNPGERIALIVSHDPAFIERRHSPVFSLDENGIRAL